MWCKRRCKFPILGLGNGRRGWNHRSYGSESNRRAHDSRNTLGIRKNRRSKRLSRRQAAGLYGRILQCAARQRQSRSLCHEYRRDGEQANHENCLFRKQCSLDKGRNEDCLPLGRERNEPNLGNGSRWKRPQAIIRLCREYRGLFHLSGREKGFVYRSGKDCAQYARQISRLRQDDGGYCNGFNV